MDTQRVLITLCFHRQAFGTVNHNLVICSVAGSTASKLCVCVCVYVPACVCACLCVWVCVYAPACVCLCVFACVSVYVCVCAYGYVCVLLCVCVCLCMHAYMCMCMFVCVSVCFSQAARGTAGGGQPLVDLLLSVHHSLRCPGPHPNPGHLPAPPLPGTHIDHGGGHDGHHHAAARPNQDRAEGLHKPAAGMAQTLQL